MHRSERCHPNTLEDWPGGDVAAATEQLQAMGEARDEMVRAVSDYYLYSNHAHKSSVYTGVGGAAYALWAVGSATGSGQLHAQALDLIRSALSCCRDDVQVVGKSLLCGHAGLLTLAAAITPDLHERAARLEEFVSLHSIVGRGESEFLYGQAGYLFGCLFLNKHLGEGAVPPAHVAAVARDLLEVGREMGRAARGELRDLLGVAPPLMYSWHGSIYVGAAHGLMGILHVLLHCTAVLEEESAREDVRASLDAVLQLEADGNFPASIGGDKKRKELVHWCHGAPGGVFLFCRAYECFQEPLLLAAALRAGEATWREGLVRKGPGICHGVAGNGYALLRLFRCSGDPKWLHRARQFGSFLCSPEGRADWGKPDHNLSLFEGLAGSACFLTDVTSEDSARAWGFPLYEL